MRKELVELAVATIFYFAAFAQAQSTPRPGSERFECDANVVPRSIK